MDRNPWIPPEAKPRKNPKQRQFLALADVPEVFYGGAAGGGKTYATLMAAAQFVEVPGYAALLLRENFADLGQAGAWMPLSKSWWMGRAHWNAAEHRWTFPSGATITFGYLERDDSVYQYDSAQFSFIGIDELTQHTEWRYRFLFGRLRRPLEGPAASIPLRMRATSNPGNRGHSWVFKRFVDPRTRAPGAVFVPARLEDNAGNLDTESYRAVSLAQLDPITRAQREQGDWNAIAGGRFKREWLRYYTRHGDGFNLGGKMVPAAEVVQRFLTVDPAASVPQTAKSDPDYTAISAWALTRQGDLLWLGCLRLRVEVPDIIPRVAEQYRRHRAGMAYIEGGGPQKAVAQLARRWEQPRLNVVEVPTAGRGDKLVKATPALNMAEAGRVWLPAREADPVFPLEDVEAELLRFTGDEKKDGHDDVVDTLAMAGAAAEGRIAMQSHSAPYVVGR